MDKQIDVCFDRVEKALSTLVDSISKYHPSVHQVNELGLADIELNKGLEDRTSNALPTSLATIVYLDIIQGC